MSVHETPEQVMADAAYLGQAVAPAPSPVDTALVAFDSSEPATVRNAPSGLAELTDKANWRSYERDMLFWRAAGQFMRRHCPALAGGLVTREELGEGGDD